MDEGIHNEFKLFENGELRLMVNNKQKCVQKNNNKRDRNNRSGLKMVYCKETTEETMWKFDYCDKDLEGCALMQEAKCIEYLKSDGIGLKMEECVFTNLQRFTWVIEGYTPPKVKYIKRACNEEGKMEIEIADEMKVMEGEVKKYEVQIKAGLQVGIKKGEVKFKTAVSNSWEESKMRGTTMKMSCDYDEEGKTFYGGCLWQVQVSMENWATPKRSFEWTPRIITCTKTDKPPTCPPFSTPAECVFNY